MKKKLFIYKSFKATNLEGKKSFQCWKYLPILFLLIFLLLGLAGCDFGEDSSDDFLSENYTLTVAVEGEGSVSPALGTHGDHKAGTVIELSASPAPGWSFSHWKGNVQNRYKQETKVVINNNTAVTAVFTADDGFDNKSIYQDNYFMIEYPAAWEKTLDYNALLLSPDDEALFYIERDSFESDISRDDFVLIIDSLEEEWNQDDEYELKNSYSREIGGQQGWEYILESQQGTLSNKSETFISSHLDLSEELISALSSEQIKMQVSVTYLGRHLFLLIYGNTSNNFDNYVLEIDRVIESFEFQYGQLPDDEDEPEEVIRYEEVKEMEPEIAGDILSFSDAEDKLVFSRSSSFVENLQVGEILLSNPGDEIPHGLIHRITDISQDGLTVYTEPVTLEEVIKEGKIELKESISFEEFVEGLILAQDVEITSIDMGEHKVEFERKIREGVKLSGFIRLASEIDLNVTSSYYVRLNTFDFVVDADMEMEVKFETDLGIDFPEYENDYKIFTFWGPRLMFYPGVWITPRFEIRAGLAAEIGGSISSGVNFSRQVEAGLRYDRSKSPSFTTVRNISGDGWGLDPIKIIGSAEALAYGGFDLSGFAWGSAGMAVGVFGYSEGEGEVSLDLDGWAWEYDFHLGAKVASKAQLELIRIASLSYDGPEYEVFKLPLAYAVSGRVVEEVDGETEGLENVKIDFAGTTAFGGEIKPAYTDENGFWHKELLGGNVTATPFMEGYVFDPDYAELDGGDSKINFEAREDVILNIVPDSLKGETNERYDFELIAENIPEDLNEVRLVWDFDDGIVTDGSNLSKDDEEVYVINGRATHTISHEYKEEGSYTMTARVENLLGEVLADAAAPAEIELDSVEVFITGDRYISWILAEDSANETEHTFNAVIRPAGTGEYRFVWNFADGSEDYIDTGETSTVSHYYTNLKDGDEFRPSVKIYDLMEPEILIDEDSILIEVVAEDDEESENGEDHISIGDMIFVEAGTTSENNGYVTVADDFYIGKYHVTQGEFESVMGYNPSLFTGGNHSNLTGNSSDRPVEHITFFDALKYCNKLSAIEGLDKLYNITDITYYGSKEEISHPYDDTVFYAGHPNNIKSATVTLNEGANGYRLPTTFEWVYAARGGKNGTATAYAGSNNLNEVGWYADNSHVANSDVSWTGHRGTMPVGLKSSNELGLYDMSGNVCDWASSSGFIHGGGWRHTSSSCQVNSRDIVLSGARVDYLGFRIARSP